MKYLARCWDGSLQFIFEAMDRMFKKSISDIFLISILIFFLSSCNEKELEKNQQFSALLAITWEPAFCEKKTLVAECRSQSPSRYDATHFSLHGLWPISADSEYCNISPSTIILDKKRRWNQLPDLRLDAALKNRLDKVMPGTQSFLQRHEWVKHGSCYKNGSANQYFTDMLRLIDEINHSSVQKLFMNNLNKNLEFKTIQSAFEESFGHGAGARVRMECSRDGTRSLIEQITINVRGSFDKTTSLAHLILAANPAGQGCNGGIVDVTGLQ